METKLLRSIVAVLVVLLLAAAAGGAYWKFVAPPPGQAAAGGQLGGGKGGPPRATPVEAVPVRVGPAEVTTEAVGTLRSYESVVLRPEVTGRIASFNFEEGKPVAVGQVMVGLDASVEQAQLAEAQAQLELATANLERARELRRSSAGTQRSLDEAQAQQRTGAAAVDLAKARLAKLTLNAPFAGVAGLRRVSVGDFVTAGTELVNLEQIQPLKVEFRVPELFLPTLFAGHGERKIAVTIDAFPGELFEGKVYALNPLVDEQGRAIVVRAEVANPSDAETQELRLRPGLFARVTLTLAQEQDALWVPEEALVPQGSQQLLFKVVNGDQGQKIVKQVAVKLGARQDGEVQIVSGLDRADIVVTAGTLKIRDGAVVTVQEPPGHAVPPTASETAPPAAPPARAQAPAFRG